MIGELFRPSGGLVYHLRARLRAKMWDDFRSEVAGWLSEWNPPERELLLIGPSAGYTLSTAWLERFERLVAIDVDPLARPLFRLRHRPHQIQFLKQNFFWREDRLSVLPLKELLLRHPSAAILFSNVLGQLPLEGKVNEAQWRHFLSELHLQLRNRTWASYHDLFTIQGVPRARHAEILRAFRENQDLPSALRLTKGAVRITDHLTGGPEWKEGLTTRFLGWSFSPTRLQVVEAILNSPTA